MPSNPVSRRESRTASAVSRIVLTGCGLRLCAALSFAQTDAPLDLATLSLEELGQIKVTTVSRAPREQFNSAAAIEVITQEDIRRSGATSLPEALRLAPGLHVARLDAHSWAIGSRGFNGAFANKLLVMIDGRSVYTPLFSGVWWDVQDTVMEDIDRIEVIRGPGATLWGANAVNGVINIITRSARDTQGGLISAGAGTEETGFASFRYGEALGENGAFRLYGKYNNRDGTRLPNGSLADDRWQIGRLGFRTDWDPSDYNQFTLQGEAYRGEIDQTITRLTPAAPFAPAADSVSQEVKGGHILGRWTHTVSADSDWTLQTYFDRTERDVEILSEERDTFDLDFQHRLTAGSRHSIVWGLGYRLTADQFEGSFDAALTPSARTDHLPSAFIQDEIELIEDRLWFTAGAKYQHNEYTGNEFQPGARLLWKPRERHTLWASVTRAVRTPSRVENDIRLNREPVFPAGGLFPGSPAAVTSFLGNRGVESEELVAYELGYRTRPHERLTIDAAAFYNVYDNLVSVEPIGFLAGPGAPSAAATFGNQLSGETYGGEIGAQAQVTDWARVKASYTLLQTRLHTDPLSGDTTSAQRDEGRNPQQQFSLRGAFDLTRKVEFDAALSYIDRLPGLGIGDCFLLDLRLAWRPTARVEMSIVGQGLLDNRQPQFLPAELATQPAEIERSVYGKIVWKF